MSEPVDPRVALFIPKEPGKTMTQSVAVDHSGKNVARSITNERGDVVGTSIEGAVRSDVRSVAQDANKSAGVPWSSARDPKYHSPVGPMDVQEDTILTFPSGIEVTFKQAKTLGYVSDLPQRGQLEQPQQQQPQQQSQWKIEQQQEEHPDLKAEAFPEEDRAADVKFSELVNGTQPGDQIHATQEFVETGEISERTLGALASQLGIEPSALKDGLQPVLEAFERQGRTAFSEGGLDADEVIRFAQEKMPNALKDAMQQHSTLRTTRGYADIRQQYLESLGEFDPDTAMAAKLGTGVTQFKDDKGRVVVKMPNGATMLWRSAIKAFGRKGK